MGEYQDGMTHGKNGDATAHVQYGLSASPSIPIVRWRIFTAFDRHDVAGFGLVIEMQLDPTSLKLS